AQFEKELALFDVTLAQWGALIAIDAGRASTPSELARAVGIDKGAATRLIARLSAKKLVEREENLEDGRSTLLTLSAEARELMPTLTALSKKVNNEMLALLSPSEGRQLKVLLANLTEKLIS
ncbi:MAG: MarR family transcriptional regulator, partial [Cyanobacteria bacterium P01_C01_bin.70]